MENKGIISIPEITKEGKKKEEEEEEKTKKKKMKQQRFLIQNEVVLYCVVLLPGVSRLCIVHHLDARRSLQGRSASLF